MTTAKDDGRTEPATYRPWRAACVEAAQAAAEAEARIAWQVDAGAPLPFNHRWEHVRHVVHLAAWLAGETGADHEIVEAAAWLHDVQKSEPEHAVRGAIVAERLLPTTDFPPQKVSAVADAIRQHAGMTRAEREPLRPLEAAVLWDADKLSKIGVQALIYNVSSHYVQGMTLSERRRWNQEFVDDVLFETVKNMNTSPAQALAEERYRQNVEMMAAWARDEGVGDW